MQVSNIDNVVRGLGLIVAVFTAAYAGATTMFACGPQPEPQLPGYCRDETQLKARYATCVADAKSREESDDCADAVNATCGFKKVKR